MLASDTPEITLTLIPVAFSNGAMACSAIAVPHVPPHVASTISFAETKPGCRRRAGTTSGANLDSKCCSLMAKGPSKGEGLIDTNFHWYVQLVCRLAILAPTVCRVNALFPTPMPSTTTALSSAALSFSDVVKKRRSVYSYLDVPVPTAIVEDAIAMAVLAPNHYRTRPWRFFVFVGAGRARLAAAYKAAALRLGRDVPKATQRVYDAPVMVAIACIPTTSNPRVVRSEEEFATA